jgi:hypothetical protein
MTFSKKSQDKKLPLIEDKFSESLYVLNTKFVEFSRLLDELKGFAKELSIMQPKQFNKKKDIMYRIDKIVKRKSLSCLIDVLFFKMK